MTVREIDGVDDNIICGTGGLSAMTHGTVAVLAQRRATGDFFALLGVNDSGGALLGSVLVWNNSDWTWFTSAGGSKSTTPSPLNTWALLVVRKDTGSATPRFSIFDYGTDAWTHEAGDASQGNWTAPGAGGSVEFSDAGNDFPAIRVAARAAWADSLPWSADATGDAAIEAAGLETAYQNWIDESPSAAWRFNQADVATPVVDDTGNGADQTGITGTTVVAGDDPPGFDFSLGEDHQGDGDPCSVTLTPATGAGTPAVAGSGAGCSITLTPDTGEGTPAVVGSGEAVATTLTPGTGSGDPAVTGSGQPVQVLLTPDAGAGVPALVGAGQACTLLLTPAPGGGGEPGIPAIGQAAVRSTTTAVTSRSTTTSIAVRSTSGEVSVR